MHIASQQETIQSDIDGVIFSLTYVSLIYTFGDDKEHNLETE